MNIKEPKIQELEALSPSIFNIYRKCPKKSAYYLDPEFDFLSKGSTSSSLGKIAHAVLAESFDLDSEPGSKERLDWFDSIWNENEKKEYLFLQENWKNSFVPKPISWSRYYSIKTSIKYKVLNKSAKKVNLNYNKHEKEVIFPIIEKFFINKELGLKGKPDLIEKVNNFISIADYKTGNINEDNKENYVIQLHLYLLLIEKSLNLKIDKLYLFGNTYEEIPIDKSLLLNLNSEIRSALDLLRQGKFEAKVSFENCRYCPFKIYCNEFWLNEKVFPENSPIAFKARIIELEENTNIDFKVAEVEIIESVPKNFLGMSKIFKIHKNTNLQLHLEYYFFNNIYYLNENNFEVQWNSIILSA